MAHQAVRIRCPGCATGLRRRRGVTNLLASSTAESLMPGETQHEAGREGVDKARDWLDRSGRVRVLWTVYDSPAHLEISCPSGKERSLDLTAIIEGGDLDKQQVYAEVKHVDSASKLPVQYEDFLADCYCKLLEKPGLLCQFMFITWHPFLVSKWNTLTTKDRVKSAVSARRQQWLGSQYQVDDDLCRSIAETLWLVVLSDKHHHIQMDLSHVGLLQSAIRSN